MVNDLNSHDQSEKDLLRVRFTSWLNKTLIRAKGRYVENHRQKLQTVSLEEIPSDLIPDPKDYYEQVEGRQTEFAFEEEKLANAFLELPLMRQEVLRLLFVEEKSPKEISEQLCCSENYVHLQKSRAIKKLREMLAGDGGDHSDKG